MMNKCLIFTDIHFKLSNKDICLAALAQCESIALSKGITNIYCLGDFVNDKAVLRSEVLRETFAFFKQSKCHWTILVGNHDLETTLSDNGHHALEIFNENQNVSIIDRLTHVAGSSVYMVPFYRDPLKFKEDILAIPDGSVLFIHQGIEGAAYSSGVSQQSEIKPADLARFKFVIGGHIHKPQQIGNIYYLGSPITHSFGEAGEDKRIAIFDFDKAELEEEIRLDLPKHAVFEVDADNLNVDHVNNLLQSNLNGYNRVTFKGTATSLSKINKSLFIPCDDLAIQKVEIEDRKHSIIAENMSYESMVEAYLLSIKTDLNQEELKKINSSILESALNAD